MNHILEILSDVANVGGCNSQPEAEATLRIYEYKENQIEYESGWRDWIRDSYSN